MLYAVLATLLGAVVTVISRLQIARQRGRRRVADRLPEGPLIVIANHTSHVDGILLALVCRRLGRSLRLLTTSGVFRAPIVGSVARRLGFIPVDRGAATAAASLDAAVEALAAGEAIGIFPEGRLTRDPDRWPERAKTGAVRLALRSGASIVPVAMVGSHRVLDRGHVVRQVVMNVLLRPTVDTAVGPRIDITTWGVDPNDLDQVRAASDRVMAALIDLVEELRGQQAPAEAGVERAPD